MIFFDFFLTLIMLSLFLTFSAAMALLLRHFVPQIRGRVMRTVWTLLLILAIIPIRLPLPDSVEPIVIHLETETFTQPEITLPADKRETMITDESAEIAAPQLTTEKQASSVINRKVLIAPTLFGLWICGAAGMVLYYLLRYMSSTRYLKKISAEVSDHPLFCEIKDRIGVRGKVRLYAVNSRIIPGSVGLFEKAVFLSRGDLDAGDDMRLSLILTHELHHIKNRDSIRSFVCVLLSAFHWFNPAAHIILRKYTADAEIMCDEFVTKNADTDAKRLYMHTILDTASQNTFSPIHTSFSDSDKKKMKERFNCMMKKSISKKMFHIILCAVLLLAVGTNALILSACTVADESDAENSIAGSDLEKALRLYYWLADDEPLTDAHLADITSIEIRKGISITAENETTPPPFVVEYIINGIYISPVMLSVGKDYMDETLLANVTDEWSAAKMRSFFTLKDAQDPDLDEKDAAELLARFPYTDITPRYVLDPVLKLREYHQLMGMMLEDERLSFFVTSEETYDVSVLSVLKNCESVVLRGLTAAGDAGDIVVTEEEALVYDADVFASAVLGLSNGDVSEDYLRYYRMLGGLNANK